ncbi:hypothetical protein ACGFNU_21220 [Spirillospora sp. NPDC048911]
MTDLVPEHDFLDRVDTHPDSQRPTDPDEVQVLRELYGEPDDDGIFRGER